MTRSSTSASSAAQHSTNADAEGVTGPSSSAAFREAARSKITSLKRKQDPQVSVRVPESVRKHGQLSTKPGAKPSTTKSTSAKTQHGRAEFNVFQTDDAGSPLKKRKGCLSAEKEKLGEKRLRLFRKKAPQSYLEKLARATSQRMFVLDRMRSGTDDTPEETIAMAGSTGNIYDITICQVPRCTCPDNQKGNQCKHIVYILHKVLKAPEHLQYQLALLSSELRDIFANAPIVGSQPSPDASSNRKEISGDCPICFTEFEPETEDIVWCKAACGNNIHKGCFEQWAKSQKGKEVRCVYCRTPWQGDPESLARIKTTGMMNEEGYVNVADQLGLSGERGEL
ncbi:MAG: hypothetical protein HETSPECPRED_008249 [Heterodermia speciosa]|uniref:Uncharacterized protein n=1 Tax=Heterodermia speciosa TaxID=116794 RepID=A0A8H3FW39_9LECA|nr:MAG: hypothetical protein HETSPECPRED_008249 [Heterodermia speciosa]